jgi:toxin YoeB
MYKIILSPKALEDASKLRFSEPKVFKKLSDFIEEIKVHPKTGTGHPEPLKGSPEGRWSRKLSKKHRLVYRIFEKEVYIDILSAYGHYDDK